MRKSKHVIAGKQFGSHVKLTLFKDLPGENWPSMDRYAESLAAELPKVVPGDWKVKMPSPPDRLQAPRWLLAARLFSYPLWARAEQGDINHIVDHSYGHLLFVLNPGTTVVTVHDIAALHFPGQRFGLSGMAWNLAWSGIQRAQHVIVDSHFIARELQSHLQIPPERYYYVPLAVSPQFHPQPPDKVAELRRRYQGNATHLLLHVGHTQPRKNIPALLRAIRLLLDRGLNVKLVQVGGVPTAEQQALVADLSLERAVQFVGQIPFAAEASLSAYYGIADVFVFPSLYEGFGMPVLEAMACNTPVVAGNSSSLPEVVGDAGLLADPESPEAIAAAIARIFSDAELAKSLRIKGAARAATFSWALTARCALTAYRSVIGLS